MIPAVEVGKARVFLGDCVEVMRSLPDNSVDSVVTDPPYGLEFMGKEWDAPWKKSGNFAGNIEPTSDSAGGVSAYASARVRYSRGPEAMVGFQLWATEWAVECLRVLKPGGHILAFGGSRTWHRLAVAVEDAGFELRDSIAWLYGSGFPKSLDVSKAIDKKRDDSAEADKIASWLASHLPSKVQWLEVDKMLGTVGARQKFFTPSTASFKARVCSWEQWLEIKNWLSLDDSMDSEVWRLNGRKGKPGENWDRREVIGTAVRGPAGFSNESVPRPWKEKIGENYDLTAPATSDAQKWQGWGTALKPAFEPVVVGRKPLVGTVAENVLLWGVGGLNIDGSRIGSEKRPTGLKKDGSRSQKVSEGWDRPWKNDERADRVVGDGEAVTVQGRWPANVILDEVSAGLLDEQSGVSKSPKPYTAEGYKDSSMFGVGGVNHGSEFGDTGGASRFFYVAKASKRDRNEGLEDLEAMSAGDMVDRVEGSAGMDSPRAGAGRTSGAKNFHPTVKPTQLMRYLIKLVTPEGGVVLDPFTGSGSTGKAALLDGYQFIGAELTEEYLPIIEGRLRWASEQEGEADDTLF